jgi:3-hydroxybutyryl-CoA dehydratase
MLLAALFPAIIGSIFPGAVYLSQTLKFKKYALVR